MTLIETRGDVGVVRPRDPRSPWHRLDLLCDVDTIEVLSATAGTGIVTVTGRIGAVDIVAFASDPSVQGGALGAEGCAEVAAAYDLAIRTGRPIIGIWHSGGARLAEGVSSLDGVGQIFASMTRASGRVPQISVVLGPAAGGAAYGPALTDIVILGPHGRVFVTGPDVVRSVTGEDVDMLRLGGPEPHGRRSGVVHVVTDTDEDALLRARDVTSLLGDAGTIGAVEDRPLDDVLPDNPRRAYDVGPLVDQLLDGPGVELHPRWAPNIVTTLGRLGGRSVGVLANNPMRLGGCLDAASAEKAARFVRMCDAFGVPLVVLVDVPGYLPGVGQEWDGVVRRGAKLLHAFAEAVVPRVTVVTRKAYGGAYIAMNAKSLGATKVVAWPGAEIAVMGSVAAVRVLHRRKLAEAAPEAVPALEQELAAEHERLSGGLARAVAAGVVDAVIAPERTRSVVAEAIRSAAVTTRRGGHGNIPL